MTDPAKDSTKTNKDLDFYDNDEHSYEEFWETREYEHLAEEVALRRLLKGKHFNQAMDFGGGYGRLAPVLFNYVDHLTLVDPSVNQLAIAKQKFKQDTKLDYLLLNEKNYIPAKDNSIDLLLMIRVSHHVLDPNKLFQEIYRTLTPNGYAVIEVASNAHFVNRLKLIPKLQTPSKTPIRVGKIANGIKEDTPFVNHNPSTIIKQLEAAHLKYVSKLSVSNLRSQFLKKHLVQKDLLRMEAFLQNKLSYINFGPSIFILVKK